MARPHYSGPQMETTSRESVREVLYGYLAGKGLRKTTQRDAIIEAAFSTKDHFNAEELLVMAKRIDSSVSRATVYRTLPLLVESGLLRELDLGGETKVYDPNFLEHPTHNHLVCVDCKKIIPADKTKQIKGAFFWLIIPIICCLLYTSDAADE